MIQSNNQLYQEINKIINALKHSNETIYIEKLQNAFTISTIPSEVLGELRLVLQELEKENLLLKGDIKESINISLRYINSIM